MKKFQLCAIARSVVPGEILIKLENADGDRMETHFPDTTVALGDTFLLIHTA